MLDRIARLPGAPCLLARGTQLGEIAFYYVKGLCWAILGSQGEINRANSRSYHLPVLSAEQKDSQSEEINLKDGAEKRPVPTQEAEIR